MSDEEEFTAKSSLEEMQELEEQMEQEQLLDDTLPTARLLDNIDAPFVTIAQGLRGQVDEDGLEAEENVALPQTGGNMANSLVNMANSIIGAGIIGLPYSFRKAGLLFGIVLLLGLTVLVDWTIRLIVLNAKLGGRNTYQETVAFCYGRPGLIAVSLAQILFAFGGMCAFCVIIGDTIPHVLIALFPGIRSVPVLSILSYRRAVIVICTLFISYPLSLYRDITKLARASALALVSMVVIVLTVVIKGPLVDQSRKGSTLFLLPHDFGFLQAIGVISFAFVCHHNSLLIYGALKKPTMDRFAKVTHYSTGISLVACMIMALAGFITFKEKTAGNILNNFPRDDIMVNIARFCFGFNCFTTFPLELFVCREVVLNYFWPGAPFLVTRHVIITSVFVLLAMCISLTTCDLGIVLEITGSTSAVAIAFLLPPLCYMKLASGSIKDDVKKHLPPLLCVGFATFLITTSIIQFILRLITSTSSDSISLNCFNE